MKSKFYKNPEAPFSLGFTYICPSCKTEIVKNENKILDTSRTYLNILQPLAYSFGTIYIMGQNFSRNEALSLVFVVSLLVIFITNKLVALKVPSELQYWRKNLR